MGNYDETLKEIEATMGSVPGYMKALTEDVLMQE
jgi:hypothetical protein